VVDREQELAPPLEVVRLVYYPSSTAPSEVAVDLEQVLVPPAKVVQLVHYLLAEVVQYCCCTMLVQWEVD
jgi:hypothetical protein